MVMRPSKSGILILLIDDDGDALQALAELLIDEGYRVKTARDLSQAQARYAEADPDLIITDLCIPGADGLEILRLLDSSPKLPPTIVMTGLGAEARLGYGALNTAVHLIEKPLHLEELFALIQRLSLNAHS